MSSGLTVTLLRAWMWAMPIIMIATGVIFAGVAAADESWALVAMMVIVAFLGVVLLILHWWLLYRFGKESP